MKHKQEKANQPPPAKRKLRDQSETEGRIGEGKNAGVRNAADGTTACGCSGSDGNAKRADATRNPDVRVGAKGVMQQDIGESICLQPGNVVER